MGRISTRHTAGIAACLLIIASVWRLPIAFNPRVMFQVFFELAVLGLFVALLWRSNKWIGLFLFLAAVSTVYPFPGPVSWVAFRSVIYALLWYFFLVFFVTEHRAQHLMDALCIIALCNVLLLIIQAVGIHVIYKPLEGTEPMPVGLMSNRNEVSCLLALCLPAFFSRKKWKYFVPVIGLGFALAPSVGGILAAAIGILFYLCIKGKIIWGLFFTMTAVLLYCLFIDTPGLERWETWKKGWGFYKQHWILGSGLGHWKVVFKQYKVGGVVWRTAHNELLQGVFEMGIGFAVIALGYALNIIRRFKKDAIIPAMAIVIILANSLVHFGFHIATTMMIAVTWMAILEVELKEK